MSGGFTNRSKSRIYLRNNVVVIFLYESTGSCFKSVIGNQNSLESTPIVLFWATLKAGMTERRNDGMAESRNGGKLPQILKDGIAESRNGGKYPQILKDGMMENHPKS